MHSTLEEIQDGVLDQVHAGQPVDEAAVLAAHPEHAEDLQAFFSVIALVEGSTDGAGIPPTRLGEYRIVKEIGRGGMGVVYEAEQTSLKRKVALKILPPMLRMDPRLVIRFRREAEAAGRLRHPGIVPVYAVGEAAGTPFFAMELIEGTSLQQIINARREGQDAGLPTEPEAWQAWAVEAAACVADALAYAHDEGILHRDIKPANILLDDSGAVRLTDFGLAQDLRAPGLTQTGELFGSPQYMSPEQAIRRDSPVDGRSDVYSLAVTLYELLALKIPYDGTTNAEVLTALTSGRVVPPRRANPEISRPLESVLLRALRLKPRERYADAKAFAKDLRAASSGAPTVSRAALVSSTRSRVAVGVLVAAVLGLGAWWLGSGSEEAQETQRVEAPIARTPRPAGSKRDEGVPEILAGYEANRTRTLGSLEPIIERLKRIDSQAARAALRRVYTDLIKNVDRDNAQARSFLGHLEFRHQIPSSVGFRGHPFLEAVAAAAKQRWFPPEEHADLVLAQTAWKETQEHVVALARDQKRRGVDDALSGLAQDQALRGYSRRVRFADPYLVCYLSKKPLSVYETLAMPGASPRRSAQAEIEARATSVDAILNEHAILLRQLHAEFMARYAKDLRIRSVTSEWGGRPDYPRGTRKFADGRPLTVLVFENRDAFLAHHDHLQDMPIGVGGFFSPETGMLSTFDVTTPDPKRRQFEILKLAHEGVHQIEHWYTRQRSRWQRPETRQDWFGDGWAEYLGAVQLPAGGKLRFTGIPVPRVRAMQALAQGLKRAGKSYPVFPVERLTYFENYGSMANWASNEWGIDPSLATSVFYAQSWALVHFLSEGNDGAYRERFAKFVGVALSSATRPTSFQAAFESETLDREFQTHVAGLLKLDLSQFEYVPAPHGSLAPLETGPPSGVRMTFEVDFERARERGLLSETVSKSNVIQGMVRVIKERLRLADVGSYEVMTEGERRLRVHFDELAVGRRDELVGLITRLGRVEFRVEVLPVSELRKRYPFLEESPKRKDVWPGTAAEFDEYKSHEVGVWTRAQDLGSAYIPSRVGFRVVPRAGAGGEGLDAFHVVEVPAPTEVFDGTILERPTIAKDQRSMPIVNFEIRPASRNAFGDWTEKNQRLPLAIILDGEVRSTPIVNARLDTSVQITMTNGPIREQEQEARSLAAALEAGALPVRPRLVSVEGN